MDANHTHFHLLLGETDWARCVVPKGAAIFSSANTGLEWDAETRELRLRAEPFRFRAAPRDRVRILPEHPRFALSPKRKCPNLIIKSPVGR